MNPKEFNCEISNLESLRSFNFSSAFVITPLFNTHETSKSDTLPELAESVMSELLVFFIDKFIFCQLFAISKISFSNSKLNFPLYISSILKNPVISGIINSFFSFLFPSGTILIENSGS